MYGPCAPYGQILTVEATLFWYDCLVWYCNQMATLAKNAKSTISLPLRSMPLHSPRPGCVPAIICESACHSTTVQAVYASPIVTPPRVFTAIRGPHRHPGALPSQVQVRQLQRRRSSSPSSPPPRKASSPLPASRVFV